MTAKRFEGQVVIVTGGGKGLGEADAKLFAQEGAQVIVADVDQESGRRVAEEIGETASFRALDVADENAWQALIADVLAKHGKLDVLVNNAGIINVNSPETITAEDLRRAWEVNVVGTMYGCKHALPALKRNEEGGAIVNMSSITAVRGVPHVVAYSATKGAIEAYTRSLAVYCAQSGLRVRVNAVLPAAIDTPMFHDFAGKLSAFEEPAGEPATANDDGPALGHPHDVAALVAFLASPDARFLNGQCIKLDNSASVTLGHVPS